MQIRYIAIIMVFIIGILAGMFIGVEIAKAKEAVILNQKPIPVYLEKPPLLRRDYVPQSQRNREALEKADIYKLEVSPELEEYAKRRNAEWKKTQMDYSQEKQEQN